MQLIVLADAAQKEVLAAQGIAGAEITWIQAEAEFLQYTAADAFLDLEYINTGERKTVLQQLLPKPVIINSVVETLADTNPAFVRVNGWPTFFSSPLTEAACSDAALRKQAEEIFTAFGKKLEWLPDEPGFVTARVVAAVINEAFLALAEGVSSKEEINTAMKLGTAYPYGPFEWAEKIGVQNVVTLLQKLCETEPRYAPAELLVQETNKAI